MKYLQSPLLFENLGNKKFQDVSQRVGLTQFKLAGRGGAYGDYDNDGDIDVAIVNMDDRPLILRNQGGNILGHWLEVKLIGTKSNRDGIGALVKIVTEGRTQYDRVRCGGSYLSGSDLRLLFGLGDNLLAHQVEILWPSGVVDRLTDVKSDQFVVVEEGRGPEGFTVSSCQMNEGMHRHED